jgi:3-hydroxyisobutyrate dehydrogenase
MTTPTSPATAVIGLGQMGGGIARNIAAKSKHLAAVWDVAPDAAARAPKGVPLMEPRKIAALAELVIFVVPSTKEIEQLLSGPDGMLAVDKPGQIMMDLTSSHPAKSRRLAKIAAQSGRIYMDAGMSGGATGADNGRLTLMCGGSADALEKARPALAPFSPKQFLLGDVGAGHTMKLIHNMILHTQFFAVSEGCRVAEKAGIPLEKAIEVLNNGFARSVITEHRFPSHIISKKWDARSVVSNLAKDVGLCAEMARDMGQPAPFGTMTSELLNLAMDRGMANTDFSRLYLEMDALLATKAPNNTRG